MSANLFSLSWEGIRPFYSDSVRGQQFSLHAPIGQYLGIGRNVTGIVRQSAPAVRVNAANNGGWRLVAMVVIPAGAILRIAPSGTCIGISMCAA